MWQTGVPIGTLVLVLRNCVESLFLLFCGFLFATSYFSRQM